MKTRSTEPAEAPACRPLDFTGRGPKSSDVGELRRIADPALDQHVGVGP